MFKNKQLHCPSSTPSPLHPSSLQNPTPPPSSSPLPQIQFSSSCLSSSPSCVTATTTTMKTLTASATATTTPRIDFALHQHHEQRGNLFLDLPSSPGLVSPSLCLLPPSTADHHDLAPASYRIRGQGRARGSGMQPPSSPLSGLSQRLFHDHEDDESEEDDDRIEDEETFVQVNAGLYRKGNRNRDRDARLVMREDQSKAEERQGRDKNTSAGQDQGQQGNRDQQEDQDRRSSLSMKNGRLLWPSRDRKRSSADLRERERGTMGVKHLPLPLSLIDINVNTAASAPTSSSSKHPSSCLNASEMLGGIKTIKRTRSRSSFGSSSEVDDDHLIGGRVSTSTATRGDVSKILTKKRRVGLDPESEGMDVDDVFVDCESPTAEIEEGHHSETKTQSLQQSPATTEPQAHVQPGIIITLSARNDDTHASSSRRTPRSLMDVYAPPSRRGTFVSPAPRSQARAQTRVQARGEDVEGDVKGMMEINMAVAEKDESQSSPLSFQQDATETSTVRRRTYLDLYSSRLVSSSSPRNSQSFDGQPDVHMVVTNPNHINPRRRDFTPAYAAEYSHSAKHGDGTGPSILALGTESGAVQVFDTNRKTNTKLSTDPWATSMRAQEKTQAHYFTPHDNAIFDISWSPDDSRLLTCSADQTSIVSDTERFQSVARLMGHSGSVKAGTWVDRNIITTAARDGNIHLFDLRTRGTSISDQNLLDGQDGDISTSWTGKPKYKRGRPEGVAEGTLWPVLTVRQAHGTGSRKNPSISLSATRSVTSLLSLDYGNQTTLASGGSGDGIVRFWDLRTLSDPRRVFLADPISQTSDRTYSGGKQSRGIMSMVQGVGEIFTLTGNSRIDVHSLTSPGLSLPTTYSHPNLRVSSFYVKLAISPCKTAIASGSTSGSTFIWDITQSTSLPRKKQVMGIELGWNKHQREVGAIDWAHDQLVTCSDDYTSRIWRPNRSAYDLIQQQRSLDWAGSL